MKFCFKFQESKFNPTPKPKPLDVNPVCVEGIVLV